MEHCLKVINNDRPLFRARRIARLQLSTALQPITELFWCHYPSPLDLNCATDFLTGLPPGKTGFAFRILLHREWSMPRPRYLRQTSHLPE